MKILQDILYKVNIEGILGNPLTKVSSISFDSRTIKKGALYVAKKGFQVDGHDYIFEAIENGAKAIVCESLPKVQIKDVIYVIVKNSSQALGIISSNYYDNPSEKLYLVGITGTNGKTSTSSLLYDLFSENGSLIGLISSVKIKFANKEFQNKHTTPDAITINYFLREMVDLGVDYCFMEVSSHAIAQYRTAGLLFSGGVFTNISHEHLDYHGNFKNYRDTKKIFFDDLPKTAFALSNIDDKNGLFMLQNTKAKKYTYAIKKNADYKAQILECQFSGMLLKIQNKEVWTSLIGHFNSQNLLAVFAVADLFEISQLTILKRISKLKCVDGRFQVFQTKENITVIIDYAHTPDALKHVLKTINMIRTQNETFFALVGCGGNRDKDKRPKMGKIASELCDKVIFTSDNPRDEAPAQIISEMMLGVEAQNFKKISKITLREDAIATAEKLSKKGDIVLIAGKGHETYQEIKGKRYHFNDLELAKQIFLKTN